MLQGVENELVVGSQKTALNDGMLGSSFDSTKWSEKIHPEDNISSGGNSAGVSYLRFTKSAVSLTDSYAITKDFFKIPVRIIASTSQSQRIGNQEIGFDFVNVDEAGNIETQALQTIPAISGDITIATNVATINTVTPHGLAGGQRISIINCDDNRLNASSVSVTPITTTQFTVPLTLANATYTVGAGRLIYWDIGDEAKDCFGLVTDPVTLTATKQNLFVKVDGLTPVINNATTLTSTSTQLITSAYTDTYLQVAENEIQVNQDEIVLYPRLIDGLTAGIPVRITSSIPRIIKQYKLRIRGRNAENFIRPIAKILTAAKSGTTTATIVTDVPHGLTTLNWVQTYGMRDITNFPNLVAMTQVASVVDEYTFTIVIAGAVTANTTGGFVSLNNMSVLHTAAQNISIQSIQRTSNILTVTLNAALALPLPGDYFTLWGMDGDASQYDGMYKVLKNSASTTIEFESFGDDFGSITCGGGMIKNTDFRIYYIRMSDFTKNMVELTNARGGQTDNAKSLPVAISGGILPTVTTVTTVTTVSAVTSANLAIPGIIADIASAALTTTTTTAAITPTFGCAYTVMMAVTAVTGTTPTLDVQIQESDDTGTNWYAVYDFPRISATGNYRSPKLILNGNRIRYVQTVAGTTPSFTRSLNRLQASSSEAVTVRQQIDRSINMNSLGSTTPVLTLSHGTSCQIVANVGAITTTATQLQLEGSDDAGTTWYALGSPLTVVASSTVASPVITMSPQMLRVRVSTAGSGVTAGWVLTKSV